MISIDLHELLKPPIHKPLSYMFLSFVKDSFIGGIEPGR